MLYSLVQNPRYVQKCCKGVGFDCVVWNTLALKSFESYNFVSTVTALFVRKKNPSAMFQAINSQTPTEEDFRPDRNVLSLLIYFTRNEMLILPK